ncbi:MAG TPA: FtsX-like permease family protein, partial [Limnochordia bacterium]
PYTIMVSHWNQDYAEKTTLEQYQRLDEWLTAEVPARLAASPLVFTQGGGLGINRFEPQDPRQQPPESPYANVEFMTGIEELVTLVDGRWPGEAPRPDGTIEAVVDEAALEALNLLVGQRYTYLYPIPAEAEGAPEQYLEIPIEVVGAVRPRPDLVQSPRWLYLPPFDKTFFVKPALFINTLVGEMGLVPEEWVWYWVFDYRQVKVHWLEGLIEQLNAIETRAAQMMPLTRLWLSPESIWQWFAAQARVIRLLLFALSVPILGMVLYYVVLTANLTVQRRRSEIAMLRSRGAGAWQIVFAYAIEWLMLSGAALVIGPVLGLGIAAVMGASAGFLAFVDRTALPVTLLPDAYRYGAMAMGVAVLACLLPVIGVSRFSIVTFKQQATRGDRRPWWERYFVDLLLVGIAWWGYRALTRQSAVVTSAQGQQETSLLVDPMLFIVPLVFLVAFGLVALRLFPWGMRLLTWVTSRWSGVSWALMTRQLSRNPGQYTPLLLLLILTVSMGIYAAATARTLDRNFADRIHYATGADVVLTEQWRLPGGGPPPGMPAGVDGGGEMGGLFGVEPPQPVVYEPPFYIHQELPGVAAAARVLTREVDARIGGNYKATGTMMAIDPVEFAHVAWWRGDLNPAHRNAYLNLLIRYPEGVLLSRDFMEKNGLHAGDWISLAIQRQPIEFFVLGPVELWPTLYPTEEHPIFVANLNYVQEQFVLEPYDVWLRLEEDASLQTIVDRLREEGIYVIDLEDARATLIEGRRDPQRMGLFGILSIGFVVSGLVSILGFFLYTFLSLRNRILQFGVLRAM